MRVNLKVPFAEKEQAKKLGARWDAAQKIWYVEQQTDLAPFARWSPTLLESTRDGATAPPQKLSAFRQEGTGKVHVGADYVEMLAVCDCLPWESCDKCEAFVLKTSR